MYSFKNYIVVFSILNIFYFTMTRQQEHFARSELANPKNSTVTGTKHLNKENVNGEFYLLKDNMDMNKPNEFWQSTRIKQGNVGDEAINKHKPRMIFNKVYGNIDGNTFQFLDGNYCFNKSFNASKNLKKKQYLWPDYDYNNRLMDFMHPSDDYRNIPLNYEVVYNKDNDPIVIYNGPTEKYIYYNTKKKRHINDKNKTLSGCFKEQVAKPLEFNKRYVHLFKSVAGDKHMLGNTSFAYEPRTREYKKIRWNQHYNNIRNRNVYKHAKPTLNGVPRRWDLAQLTPNSQYIDKNQSIFVNFVTTEFGPIETHLLHDSIGPNNIKTMNTTSYVPAKNLLQANGLARQMSVNESIFHNTCLKNIGPGSCHPAGGLPKYLKDSYVNKNDKEYAKVLSGELAENVAQQILNKVLKHDKMRCEFGIYYKNLSEMRQHVINVSSQACNCTPLYGELKCFLNLLLTTNLKRSQRSHYYNVKPDRNFLFDHVFLNPWPMNGKEDTIALPPSLYGFSQQPMYSLGKERYTSKLFHESNSFNDETSNQLIYKSKLVFLPEDGD